jgi:hypothetical protein
VPPGLDTIYFPEDVGTDIGGFVYCPKAGKKCPGNGTEISVEEGVHVAPDRFLNYDPRPAGR